MPIHRVNMWLLVALTCASAAAGCQTTVTGYTPPKHTNVSKGLQEETVGGSVSSDEAVLTDPSAARLHDIAGAILLYRATKGEMPTQLADIKAVSEDDLDLTSPITHTPYVYVPAGLHYPGRNKYIIVYEPDSRPNGRRWCILTADPLPGGAQALEVLVLSEADFLAYR